MAEGKRFVVIGCGAAGLAAASRLKERGAHPVLISQGVGASGMSSGACDLTPFTDPHPEPPSPLALAFVRALGMFESPGVVATTEGFLRPAGLVGARVLNLELFRGKKIGIADFPRADFRPAALVRQLSASSWALSTETRFEVVALSGVVSERELKYPLAAFTRLFDDEERLSRLKEAVLALDPAPSAVLLGPWLGSGRTSIEVRGTALGETLSPPEGAFGGRFERARAEFCSGFGLTIRTEQITSLTLEEDQVRLVTRSSDGASGTIWADRVIVATGGLISHGVNVSEPPQEPVDVRAFLDPGVPLLGGSREGWDAAKDGGRWITPPHERRISLISASPRVIFAGDVRARASRRAPGGTFLGAVQSGIDSADSLFAD